MPRVYGKLTVQRKATKPFERDIGNLRVPLTSRAVSDSMTLAVFMEHESTSKEDRTEHNTRMCNDTGILYCTLRGQSVRG